MTEPLVREVPGLLSRPDGNNVSVDRESLVLAEVQMKFQAATQQLLKMQYQELTSAIK